MADGLVVSLPQVAPSGPGGMSLTEALQVATSLWLLPHIVRGELGVGCAGDAVAVRLGGQVTELVKCGRL